MNLSIKYASFFLLILALGIVIVHADDLPATLKGGAPYPSSFLGVTQLSNYTHYNNTPSSINWTRGYIYDLNIKTNQITHRWIGFVGNVSGNITLMDNNRNMLYSWDFITTSGEIYATRFNGFASTASSNAALDNGAQRASGVQGISDYDYVDWTHISCASREYINNESVRLQHNVSVDNDALPLTFVNSTSFKTNGMDFSVNDRYISINNDISGGCSGTFLNQNNARTTEYWQMVVLEDGSTDGVHGDLVYAANIENGAYGFNGKRYHFQMILPQYGSVLKSTTDGDLKDNLVYYFYLELIGDSWPSS